MASSPLIEPDALAAALADPDDARRPTVLDVRWELMEGARPDLYEQGHVPGAAFVDLDRELAAPVGDGRRGRHPLPEPVAFVAAMRVAGVDSGRPVVVYDDAGGTTAARAWWLLRHYGHGDVSLLHGGLSAWTAAGHPAETGPAHDADAAGLPAEPGPTRDAAADGGGGERGGAARGDFSGEPGHLRTLDADSAAELASDEIDGVLLDARAGERFRGETEPLDPAAGHIPGARSRPTADNLGSDGRFRDPADLAAAFAAIGANPEAPVGVYCGSGVTAAHEVLGLALVGIDAALYPGSWSEWSSDASRTVATGAA